MQTHEEQAGVRMNVAAWSSKQAAHIKRLGKTREKNMYAVCLCGCSVHSKPVRLKRGKHVSNNGAICSASC